MTDIRVTREAIEVLADVGVAPAIQATRIAVEVAINLDTAPVLHVTRVATEVLHTTAEASVGGLRRTIITVNFT